MKPGKSKPLSCRTGGKDLSSIDKLEKNLKEPVDKLTEIVAVSSAKEDIILVILPAHKKWMG